MKTFVLTVSERFQATHPKKGEPTYFADKILSRTKKHTIRANYDLWHKRLKDVQEGKAVLSIRYWSGKPYNSKQVEICKLDNTHSIGVQKIEFDDYLYSALVDGKRFGDMFKLAKNDGLSEYDFESWFIHYDFSKPMAIIHFTPMRY